MTYQIFVDDERKPSDIFWAPRHVQEKYHNEEWIICETRAQVYCAIYSKGIPSYISFDHDLGEDEDTGFDISKMIVNMDLDGFRRIPDNFKFYVHSQNPIGKKNIESYLNNYMKVKDQ